jgi:hypothetical protein
MMKRDKDVAEAIVAIYKQQLKARKSEDDKNIGYFSLTPDEFKKIAGRKHLKEAFIDEVDICLRDEGYFILNLNKTHGLLAFMKIDTIGKIFRRVDEGIIDKFID